jgi:FKBP-type peptidyl-prolyl cis-trans isomerase FklB
MKLFVFCISLLVSTTLLAQSKKELQAEVASLKSQIVQLKMEKIVTLDTTNIHDKASYGLGMLLGSNLKTQGGDSINVDLFIAAVKDVFQGKKLKMEQQEAMATVQEYMTRAMEAKNEKAKQAGVAFLNENKAKEGIKTTASGLQYKVLTTGKGKAPVATDKVTVHYIGKLTDGTVFDSSVDRGEPATFGVNEVIPGWTEVLQLMHEGDKWMVFIPQELAYGAQGAGGTIPPFSTLIFEVELIKVN